MPDSHVETAPAYGAREAARSRFVTLTYAHLLGAVAYFTALEVALFRSGVAEQILRAIQSVPWLVVLGAYMIVGWFASRTAARVQSLPMQYLALWLFVSVKAVIFVPLLWVAEARADGVLSSAVQITLVGFVGLTLIAVLSGKQFRGLGIFVRWGLFVALLLIVAGALFGFELGPMFSVAMIGLAGGAVLSDTAKILHRYPTDRYVSASLELFASIALMLWYVLRFLNRR